MDYKAKTDSLLTIYIYKNRTFFFLFLKTESLAKAKSESFKGKRTAAK